MNGVPSYQFGRFRLDTAERVLYRDSEPVPLTPKALEILLLLVTKHGHLIEKEELLKTLWPDTFVEEGNLTQQIFHVRKALSDGLDGKHYIDTVPRRGYRFIAPVQEEPSTPEILPVRRRWPRVLVWAAGVLALAAAGGVLYRFLSAPPPVRSLAVLPLKPLNGGEYQQHLEFGIADTIISKVSQIGSLTVRPAGAVRRYAGKERDSLRAAKELRVDAVLDGTVQRAGERLRVSFNLLRIRDGASLWADTFDVPFSDIFAVQDEVARQVAGQLRLRLGPDELARLGKRTTNNAEAYEYYLRGLRQYDQGWPAVMNYAIPLLQKAVELDPNFAPAQARLASAYALAALVGEPTNGAWVERAREALARAQSLNPDLAETHRARAELIMGYHGGYRSRVRFASCFGQPNSIPAPVTSRWESSSRTWDWKSRRFAI